MYNLNLKTILGPPIISSLGNTWASSFLVQISSFGGRIYINRKKSLQTSMVISIWKVKIECLLDI